MNSIKVENNATNVKVRTEDTEYGTRVIIEPVPEQLLEVDKLYAEKCREVAELKKRQRWIPVEERLPKLDEDGYAYVMVCMDDEFVATTDYTRDEGFRLWAECGEVVAWQPLPEGYKEEKE